MKILDWYILKKYLTTFITIQLLFVPIAIIVNLADNIDKILANEVPFNLVAEYYFNFTIYFSSSLLPLFLFLSVIWFTSKLASDTEVIAFLSSGISFFRFLRPFLIGAFIIATITFLVGLFIVPNASKDFNEFSYKYLKGSRKSYDSKNIYRQISPNDFIYLSQFNPKSNVGSNFTLEHFENNILKYKIESSNIRYLPSDSLFRLSNYSKRIIGEGDDIIINKRKLDTSFSFKLKDLLPIKYIAETLSYTELVSFIEQEKSRGSSNIGRYQLVKYKKWSIPFSVFVLTIIAFSVSSAKRRGGTGVNLAFGIVVAMVFVFFDKVFGVLAQQSDFSPLLAVWLPNILFSILAIYLLYHAKK
ncbi:MAG: LptF/LptG family permease [Flavobacteriaceae bacterium]|nr:LptF/LptG family permease [Flavobacteriaceae bacterium]CAI8287838.1 MAG: Lipopolysaccharide export system permease protein LptG [Flavobacteriaceae bacterium]|tara:strand:+ start:751 stop:1827 length:1077 start_codon:yes stop_codon:yes gene_type:complete